MAKATYLNILKTLELLGVKQSKSKKTIHCSLLLKISTVLSCISAVNKLLLFCVTALLKRQSKSCKLTHVTVFFITMFHKVVLA